jgi:hypothetical protein
MMRFGTMLGPAVAAVMIAWPASLAASATDRAVASDLRAVQRPPAFDLDRRSPPATAAAQWGNPLWAVPLSTLTVTRERPIFSASRRPPPPAAARPVVQVRQPPPRVAEPQRPRMSLVGTVAGAEGIAVFVDQTTQTIIRLRTGEGHEGWVLRAVGAREVTLQNERDTATLTLPSLQSK